MYSILNYLIKNPSEAKRIRDACYTKEPKRAKLFSSEKALGLMISAKWSRFEYNTLKKACAEENIKIPSYYAITSKRTECHPDKNEISITDRGASIKLQALLNHTASRILKIVQEEKTKIRAVL